MTDFVTEARCNRSLTVRLRNPLEIRDALPSHERERVVVTNLG